MADGMPSSQVSDLNLFIKKRRERGRERERDESEDQARLLNLVFLTQFVISPPGTSKLVKLLVQSTCRLKTFISF